MATYGAPSMNQYPIPAPLPNRFPAAGAAEDTTNRLKTAQANNALAKLNFGGGGIPVSNDPGGFGADNRMRQELSNQQAQLNNMMAQQQSRQQVMDERARGRQSLQDVHTSQTEGYIKDRIRMMDERAQQLSQTGFPGFGGGTVPPPITPTLPSSISGAADLAQNAAFGKAKATAGSLGRSALEGLREEMAGRGTLGSGIQAQGLVDRLAAATNPLSDENVAALKENVGIQQHQQDLEQQSNLAGYQGNIAQRGQNIGAFENEQDRRLRQSQSYMDALLNLRY